MPNKCKIPSNWRIFLRNSEILISKEDFTSNHKFDLDELALCTHEEADMMIFVHTKYATKGGGPEGILIAKASDTDIICIAVNCMWQSQHMNCALHWATEEQGHSRLHQSQDLMLCLTLHSATKERRCDVCDEITYVFHKLSQFPSTVIDDDMAILVRFESECMTDPAQLRAQMMQHWRCLQGAVTRRASY